MAPRALGATTSKRRRRHPRLHDLSALHNSPPREFKRERAQVHRLLNKRELLHPEKESGGEREFRPTSPAINKGREEIDPLPASRRLYAISMVTADRKYLRAGNSFPRAAGPLKRAPKLPHIERCVCIIAEEELEEGDERLRCSFALHKEVRDNREVGSMKPYARSVTVANCNSPELMALIFRVYMIQFRGRRGRKGLNKAITRREGESCTVVCGYYNCSKLRFHIVGEIGVYCNAGNDNSREPWSKSG